MGGGDVEAVSASGRDEEVGWRRWEIVVGIRSER
jgi:hypothetical protein